MSEAISAPIEASVADARTPQRFDGWRIVFACAIAQGLGVGMVSVYGFLFAPIIAEFGASDAQMGLAMSITILSMSLVGPVIGPLLDRGPIKQMMLIGVAIMLASGWAMAQATQLWQLAVALASCSIGFALYGPMPVQVLLVNWFVVRRGSALAFAGIGYSLAGLALPLAAAWAVSGYGWRGAVSGIATAAALIVAPIVAALIVNRPEDREQIPDGFVPPAAAPGDLRASMLQHSIGEIAGNANFWWIGLGMAIAQCVPVTMIFLVRHMQGFGVEPERAALVFVLMGVFGMMGKLTSGSLADRFDERWVTIGVLAIYLVGWLVMALGSSFAVMLMAAPALGFGGGGLVPMPPLLIGACFGRAVVGKVMGLQAAIGLPFLLAAGPFVGWMRDRNGDYVAAFLCLATLLLVASGVLALIRIPKRT